MISDQILSFAKEHGYASAEYLKEWNGYKCYEPILSADGGVSYVGLPLVIMAKGSEIRMSTPDEAMEI